MSDLTEADIYNAVGESGFRRLVAAFYRNIPNDDVLGPMYPPDDLDGAEDRLRGFLIGRFGGPMTYVEQRGHPRLRMRHAPFPLTRQARDRWMSLMNAALDEADFPGEVTALLRPFFEQTATFLINRPG